MNRLFSVLLGSLVAAYPLIVLFGLRVVPVYYLGLFFIALVLLRLWFLHTSGRMQALPVALCVLLLLVASYAVMSGQSEWFRYYPVAVNAILLGVFSASLWSDQPVVERLARLTDPDLPAVAVSYTRKVTVIWCCFFAVNGLAALYTSLWASVQVWAWYNGALAYCLMGLLFAGEWIVRKRVQRNINV